MAIRAPDGAKKEKEKRSQKERRTKCKSETKEKTYISVRCERAGQVKVDVQVGAGPLLSSKVGL